MGKEKVRVHRIRRVSSDCVRVSKRGKWIEVDLDGETTLRITLPKGMRDDVGDYDHGTVTFDNFDFGQPTPPAGTALPTLKYKTLNNNNWQDCPENLVPQANRPRDVTQTKVTIGGQDLLGTPVGGMQQNCVISGTKLVMQAGQSPKLENTTKPIVQESE